MDSIFAGFVATAILYIGWRVAQGLYKLGVAHGIRYQMRQRCPHCKGVIPTLALKWGHANYWEDRARLAENKLSLIGAAVRLAILDKRWQNVVRTVFELEKKK